MKKLIIIAAMSLLSAFSASAQLVLWKENTHYEIIADEASKKPVVKEFFSFWCPACYQFEPVVADIKKALPEGTKFKKVHVDFMRFATQESQQIATKGMLLGEALKTSDKINEAIFNYIHVQRAQINDMNDMRNLFIVNGVPGEKFDKTINSFGVKNLYNKNNQQVTEFRTYVTGVPSFIVNDKYKVITGAPNMTLNDYIDLIVWLSQQK